MFNENHIYIKKKDICKVNVLSRFMAMSFTVREFSCKALKEFQKSRFSMNYECLVLIQKNKGNFFLVEFICGCPARARLSRPILVENKFSNFSILSGQSVSHDLEPNIFPSDPRSQLNIT